MDIDFHYYATYVAARVAGYTDKDAYTIAHAAQYVDVSDCSNVEKDLLPDLVDPTPTIETNWKMIKSFDKNESEAIWSSFHFLPGNLQDDKKLNNRRTYTGIERWGFGISRYDDSHKRKFKLLCLPNSELSESMINDIITNHIDKPYYLHLVGIRMHVLADTWAHAYYAGTPSYWVNEATDGAVVDIDGESINQLYLKDITPPASNSDSYSYLGHGRMGHLPDIPYMVYRYSSHWNNVDIVKNNPIDYMYAFCQMVKAMQLIRYNELLKKGTEAAEAKEAANTYLISSMQDGAVPANQVYISDKIKKLKIAVVKAVEAVEAKTAAKEILLLNEVEDDTIMTAEKEEKEARSLLKKAQKTLSELIKDKQNGQAEQAEQSYESIDNKTYVKNSYALIDNNIKIKLHTAFLDKNYDAKNVGKIWNPIIETLYPDVRQLPEYNNNMWLKRANDLNSDKKNNDYYKFNAAAISHRSFVQSRLPKQ